MISICLLLLAMTALYLCYRDIRYRVISNLSVIFTGIISLAATSGMALSWTAWPMAFLMGCLLFAIKALSGGDIKLALAFLLGIDTSWWPVVLFMVTMGGGLLAMIYLIVQCLKNDLPKLKTRGIPYGVPITLFGSFGIWLTIVDLGLV